MPTEAGPPGRRRWRQLAEIERLLALGWDRRAGGLVAEHLSQFPDDESTVAEMVALYRRPDPPSGNRDGR